MHSANFTFTNDEMKTHLACMIDLLQDPKLHLQPDTDTAANDAVDEIHLVRLDCSYLLTDSYNY